MNLIIGILLLLFFLGLKDDLPSRKWFRKLRGGKWWLCKDPYDLTTYWIRSLYKPTNCDIMENEDYNKQINNL